MLVTKKAHEGDLVELTEDLPKYDLKKGQRGLVIEAFDAPNEAYDIEFEDDNGEFLGFGYSVRPGQIRTIEERKRKANLHDIVEVTEDIIEYGVKRGEQGVVVEVFDEPEEGYVLEFVDPSGRSSRLAYWVKPEQIKRVAPRKAQELEVVEVAEDLPEYGVKKGERGVVTTTFSEPDEAYDLEFVDESGQSTFAYSVKPHQITGGDEIAERMFGEGLALWEKRNVTEAEQRLKEAIRLRPNYAALLHNLVVNQPRASRNWSGLIEALRLVIRLNPDYHESGHSLVAYAKDNLANAYNNLGVESAEREDSVRALVLFDIALAVGPTDDIASRIRGNIVKACTSVGIRAHQDGNQAQCLFFMERACEIESSDQTRHNVGVALVHLALNLRETGQYQEASDALQWAIDSGLFDLQPETPRELSLLFERLDQTIDGLKPAFIAATALQELDLKAAA